MEIKVYNHWGYVFLGYGHLEFSANLCYPKHDLELLFSTICLILVQMLEVFMIESLHWMISCCWCLLLLNYQGGNFLTGLEFHLNEMEREKNAPISLAVAVSNTYTFKSRARACTTIHFTAVDIVMATCNLKWISFAWYSTLS